MPEGTLWCEIGSWKGRSTVALAQSGRQGYAIDTFRGSTEHPEGTDTYEDFCRNTAPYSENLRVLRGNSLELRDQVRPEIGLLFVDGEHTGESPENDVRSYYGVLVKGAILVLHDAWGEDGQETTTPWPDVTALAHRLRGSTEWTEVNKVRRCAVFQKR